MKIATFDEKYENDTVVWQFETAFADIYVKMILKWIAKIKGGLYILLNIAKREN